MKDHNSQESECTKRTHNSSELRLTFSKPKDEIFSRELPFE